MHYAKTVLSMWRGREGFIVGFCSPEVDKWCFILLLVTGFSSCVIGFLGCSHATLETRSIIPERLQDGSKSSMPS